MHAHKARQGMARCIKGWTLGWWNKSGSRGVCRRHERRAVSYFSACVPRDAHARHSQVPYGSWTHVSYSDRVVDVRPSKQSARKNSLRETRGHCHRASASNSRNSSLTRDQLPARALASCSAIERPPSPPSSAIYGTFLIWNLSYT